MFRCSSCGSVVIKTSTDDDVVSPELDSLPELKDKDCTCKQGEFTLLGTFLVKTLPFIIEA